MSKKKLFFIVLASSVVTGLAAGSLAAVWVIKNNLNLLSANIDAKVYQVKEQSNVISVVKKTSPAVVSIIISKNLPAANNTPSTIDPFFQQFFGPDFNQFFSQPKTPAPTDKNQKVEVGGGSGFIVSPDGYIVTNRHVVDDDQAEYTVLTNSGQKYPAKVLAKDPTNDLAVIKIDAKNLPTIAFGDSSQLQVGQSVIAIGNALGEFRNTVSTGVVSGLMRTITAGDYSSSEQLNGLIQTDASINPGNSGGPLLNIDGQVIGINVAIAQGAQNIGFAIPANQIKATVSSVQKNGRLIRPWLGVRYVLIDDQIAKDQKLPVDYGALVVRGQKPTDLAVVPGSPADKAGLKENDIILSVNNVKINADNPLVNQVAGHNVGDELTLKIMRQGKEEVAKVKLEEAK